MPERVEIEVPFFPFYACYAVVLGLALLILDELVAIRRILETLIDA